MMLFRGVGIGQNIQEILATFFGSETPGNLGLDFDHAKVTLSLIIVKRNGKILYEQTYCVLVFPQPVNQSKHLAPLAAAFPAGCCPAGSGFSRQAVVMIRS